MSTQIIKVPDIGGAEGVDVIEICVAVGDQVAVDDSLVVLESDKASMEVPSPMAGTVKAITISDGDSLSEGDVILELEADDSVQVTPAAQTPEQPQATAALVSDVKPEVISEVMPEVPSTVQASTPQATTTLEVIPLPDLGGADNVDVIEVCVAVGDEVAEGDSLLVLETDKASMELPAPKGGKIVSVAVKEGDKVSEGDALLEIEVSAAVANKPVPAQDKVAAVSVSETINQAVNQTTSQPVITNSITELPIIKPPEPATSERKSGVYAGPAVRKLAREMGIDLARAKGTGPRGRISRDDLKAHVKAALNDKASSVQGAGIPAIPAVDFSRFGEVRMEPLTKIDKLTAANMQRSWLNVPHVTQFDEADITELEAFRQSLKAEAEHRGVKITPLPFLLKACAVALQAHPKFNASLHADGEHRVYKQYIHIGMAVDTPAGLVVPVLRDVDKKSIWQLAAETAEIAGKAKARKLKLDEMQGGCFTISSLGGIGGQGFTPIVNAPEVAILGVSKLATKPVWNGSEFVPRKMLPLSLSYDHRAINGGDGGRFCTYLIDILSDIRRLLL